jgi:hypothetical protein
MAFRSWAKATYGGGMSRAFQRQAVIFYNNLEELGDWATDRLQELWQTQFDTGGRLGGGYSVYQKEWAPLHPITVLFSYNTRHGARHTPLVNTGELRDSLKVEKLGNLQWRIYFSPPENGALVQMMEFGYACSVTPKMRKWFAVQGWPLKSSTTKIVVPARPILGPVIDILNREIQGKIWEIFGQISDVSISIRWK